MDLGAYIQIEELDHLAKANDITIPRLRGYRLMINEAPINKEEWLNISHECKMDALHSLCRAEPLWKINADCHTYNDWTDYVSRYYTKYGRDEEGRRIPLDIRWNRIHGKKRRTLKFAIKQNLKAACKQYSIWNKYAGQENVLYIHSRMGGYNWEDYAEKESIISKPWFLDRVDDWWDSTYCDFYAKIDSSLTIEKQK